MLKKNEINEKLTRDVDLLGAENKILKEQQKEISILKDELSIVNKKNSEQQREIFSLSIKKSTLHEKIRDLNQIVEAQNKEIAQLKDNYMEVVTPLFKNIKDSIQKYSWVAGFGGESPLTFKIDDKNTRKIKLTKTAKSILDVIAEFNSKENPTFFEARNCLAEIKDHIYAGTHRNAFYRFFRDQDESSRNRYNELNGVINEFYKKYKF